MTERDKLILAHTHLVPKTVKRLVPKVPARIEREDLEGAGYLGLVEAADRWDPARGTAFRTLAIAWIRGAVWEYLRAEDWAPRSVREKERRGEEEVLELVSLSDVLVNDGEGSPITVAEAVPDPNVDVERQTLAKLEEEALRACVRWLPRRERALLEAYYWDDRTHRQIGSRERRCVSRIHQWHEEAMGRLRRWVERTGAIVDG